MLVDVAGHGIDPEPQRDQRADEEGGGVGEERALEPHRAFTSGRRDRTDHDGEVLRAAEQGVGGHELVVGHHPGRDGVERRGRQRLDQAERSASRMIVV